MQNTQEATITAVRASVANLNEIITALDAVSSRVQTSDSAAANMLAAARRDLLQEINELEQITGD